MRPQLKMLASLTAAGALLAMVVASTGDDGDDPWPPEGYRDLVFADFALDVDGEVLELAFDGIGQNWGNADDDGEFEWVVRLDLDEGVGPGHAMLDYSAYVRQVEADTDSD